MYEVGSQVIKT